MKVIAVALLVLFVSSSFASRTTMEEGWTPDLTKGWSLTDLPVDLTQTRNCIFMIKLKNSEELVRNFYDISTPGHALYGQHLSVAQLRERHAPSPFIVAKIEAFLALSGVKDMKLTLSGDMLKTQVSLAVAQKLFDVTYHTYRHEETGVLAAGTFDKYSLPSNIAKHIDFVSHVQGLPDISTKRSQRTATTRLADGDSIDPSVIRTRYNISSTLLVTNANNSNAVAEFQAQYFSPTDLTSFFNEYVPFAPASDGVVAKVIGTNTPADPGDEASLDVQYIMGVAPGAITWFYSQKSFNFYSDLVTWLEELNNETAIPLVISVSYGSQGGYPSNTYASRSDQEYAKIGSRGCSVVYASGDSGAECAKECTVLYPSYPAVSPHVTAIGATRFCSGNTGAECAVEAFKSGGGFSTQFNQSQADYQTSAVQAYLNLPPAKLPPASAFPASGRANPDFGALGAEEFEVIDHGRTIKVGGTSCSAPTFSAVITLLNDIRLNKNQAPLGFLNPTLYGWAANNAGAFFDVTVGDNEQGCGESCGADNIPGYLCEPGWDPVTGYGTPNFQILSTLV